MAVPASEIARRPFDSLESSEVSAELAHSFASTEGSIEEPCSVRCRPQPPRLSAVVQCEKVALVEGMPEEVQKAVEFLNYMEGSPISRDVREMVVAQLEVVERSTYTDHCLPLTSAIRAALPSVPVEAVGPELAPLKSRSVHGIWVQGEYQTNDEVIEGISTFEGVEGWTNLIWVYERAAKAEGESASELPGIVGGLVEVGGIPAHEVDFKATVAAWEDKPAWVESFLPILDVLLAKKSYVAMSDIMRMIILYYQGGLYADVKIQLATPEAKFFAEPLVEVDRLQLADGGSNTENWAMIAEAGCALIEEIMNATLARFPTPEQLARGPVNYQGGEYSKAHVALHEDFGPWNRIEAKRGKTNPMSAVNPDLSLSNPRPVNSWSNAVGEVFDWKQ